VGAIGERWLDAPSGALASPYLAPETLVAAVPTDAHTWVFVGQHGSRFTADTPLGPFASMQRSPQRYAAFAVVSGLWYGLAMDGTLWRGTWNDAVGARLVLPAPIFAFAMSSAGKGVALAIPERTWVSHNQGTDWEPVELGPFGATAISVDEQGDFGFTALLPNPASETAGIVFRNSKTAFVQENKLRHAPAEFAEAQGFTEGRATRSGFEIVELRQLDGSWHVGAGPLDKPLLFSKTQGLEDCSALHLSVSTQLSLAICRHGDRREATQELSLRVSDNHAQHFVSLPGTVSGSFNNSQIAVLGRDRFVATGLCAPQDSRQVVAPTSSYHLTNAKQYSNCVPKAPVIIHLIHAPTGGETTVQVVPVAAPGAHIVASPVAASRDGQLVAFVARANANSHWQLFFSDDAGKLFVPHSLDALPVTGAAPTTGSGATRGKDHRETRVIQSLNFAEDRSLSLVLRDGDSPIIFNFDDRGGLIAVAMAPVGVARADAVGSRILAVSLTERAVYESLDRGASFELVGHLPAAACLTSLSCPVVCSTLGCLIGERFTRVSWGGRGASTLDIAGNPETASAYSEPPTERVAFRTPLLCQPIATRDAPVPVLTHAPLPEQTSLAETLWYSPWQDTLKGSAGVFRARRGRTQVDELPAFMPIVHPERAGFAASFHDAGLAILRSTQLPKQGEALGELEVAWMRFERQSWAHARFRDAVPMKSSDSYLYGLDRARRLLPAQLSVSGEGVFVQPHADAEQQLGSYYITTAGSTQLEHIAWPFLRLRVQQTIKDKDAWRAYAWDETGTVLLRAEKSFTAGAIEGSWEFSAQTVANPSSSPLAIRNQVSAYWGGSRPFLVLGAAARGHQLQSLTAHELTSNKRPLGPALQLPLPASLNEPPPACRAEDRRELVRVVVPLLPTAARPMGIQDSNHKTHWLVANHAVVYASQSRACVDALWAETLPGTTPMHAVVALGELQKAWLFRSKRLKGDEKVEVEAIRCQMDAAANPPPELETRTQARWNLDKLPLSEESR
jgi:hypothetical protein